MKRFFETTENKLVKGLEYIVALSILMMAVLVIYQVLSRYILGAPSKYSEELATILMIWVGTFGAALGFYKGSHLGVDILTHVLNDTCKRLMQFITLVLVLVFAVVIWGYGGYLIVDETFASGNMLKTLPAVSRAFVYLPLPISGALVAFFTLRKLFNFFSKEETPEAPTTEETCEVKNG